MPEVLHNVDTPGRSPFHMQPSAGKTPVVSVQAQRPLLLFSHDTGSTASGLDWVVAALTANDYIVAGMNHPGSTALEPFTHDGFMLWWECAIDVNEVLGGVLADPVLGAYIDRTHVDAVGFSLGGYTVLELVSARTDVPVFVAFCGSPQTDAICHPLEMARAQINPTVDTTGSPQTEASLTHSGASYRGTCARAVLVMAPALGMTIGATSFGNISIPVSLMAGGADITVPVDTNVRRIAKILPKVDLPLVSGTSHYTFMDTCLPEAAPHAPLLYKDNSGVNRDTVHAKTMRQALNFFGAALPDQT